MICVVKTKTCIDGRKKMRNIVLIGMPGVGKSTVGVILAKEAGYQFVDSDLVIQQREGKLLKDIIEEKGVDGFLEVENRVNASLNVSRSVIATGGSAVYGREAMEHLKSTGTVVYLRCSFDILSRRLSDLKGRGVVLKRGQTLKDIYEERSALYEKYADIVIEENAKGIEETLAMVMEALNCANFFNFSKNTVDKDSNS